MSRTDPLLANVADGARLGALSDGAEGAHVPLCEAHLVARKADISPPDGDAERGRDAIAVRTVVGVLHLRRAKKRGRRGETDRTR